MTDNDETPQVEAATGKPAKKAKDKRKSKDKAKSKAKSKAKPARPAVEKPVAPVIGFDFVDKVDSLRVKAGAGAGGVEFSLRGRHGKRRSFRFDTADDFALIAMAHLVLAANSSGTKIGLRTGAEVDGVCIVHEAESRPRLGKDG